ncbi:RNA polymerase II mediator complex component SRB4, putative [Talaromyces stipitatus ATCC 10500]|uniref:Mediator of RNA polymerase II transcription subunit 17 n=1 Tax=Talaromyces stipitatus (strain ATCC 10500 / CBS 375.48 / QM 6759 / NRRL 1006) TaxID=441959 RepID=B8MP76_TALSN|nr:RNA polymerase II mediator complex component SRB4, putative [Talaromyces stipitatus ATCC 10500]EED14315.1 RNA polymerase II mediator complex component SRB4, putative [Talaromyces stipitatus ATCC 10500]
MEQTGSLMLPLRPQTTKTSKKDNLPIRIAQINAQRGSFRNITEQSLQDEIKAQKERSKDKLEEEEEESKSQENVNEVDATERQELLYKRRAEIIQFAAQAHMETQFALDFISLLLSKHAPRQAETSISPYLKQNVPMGSLNIDVVKAPPKSQTALRDTQNVAHGWKIESFNASANRLLKAASRLESEVAAETKYWDQVLSIKDKGWKVCRLPRERQVLGVQYGFMEAAPTFRDRGLASLRRADDGTLVLDKGLVPSRARAVRVRVKKQGKITGSSSLSRFVAAAVSDDSVEKTILQSRDTLFEEELFHELTREARVLVSSGVTAHKDLIEFEYEAGEQILLELADVDDNPENDSEPSEGSTVNNNEAEAIAYALRILLSYAHRQNLRRRSQFPPPLTNQKRPTPQYQLLRPILSYMQHDAHVRSLQSFLQDVYQVLNSAGLASKYTTSKFSSLQFKSSADVSSSTSVETLLSQFMEPLESRFSGSMANPTSTYNIRIHTTMPDTSSRQMALGTDYELTIRLPNYPYTQPPSRIGLKHEVELLLLRLFTLDLITYISSISSHNAAAARGGDFTKNLLLWESPFPHHGELSGVTQDGKAVKQLAINLSRDSLGLCLKSRSQHDDKSDTNETAKKEDEAIDHDEDPFQSEFVVGPGGLQYTRPPQRLAGGEVVHVWRREDVKGAPKTLAEVIRDISSI